MLVSLHHWSLVHQYPLWLKPNASHCKCVCLTSTAQSDRDQRIATVRTVSHEVILSAPVRLRSSYANVWWCWGWVWEGSTVFYSNSWKVDINAEQAFKVNTKGSCPGPSYGMSKSRQFALSFYFKALKSSWHKHRQAHIKPQTHYDVNTDTIQAQRRPWGYHQKVNWSRKMVQV